LGKKEGYTAMEATKVKESARRLVEELSEDATWDDLMYKIYVRQSIEAGLEDSKAGRIIEVKEVRAKFGLGK
jgi:predicted transcriptional regulator